MLVDSTTELIIEGFPRSANTWSVVAFEQIQSVKVKIAHHQHVISQILRGIKYGIPIILLIRNPKDVTISESMRDPEIPMEQILRHYIDYYTFLYDYKSAYLIANFEDVINNYRSIIDGVNLKFGTNFTSRNISAQEEELIADKVKELGRRFQGGDPVRISYPSEKKSMFKLQLRATIEGEKYRQLLEKAESVYQQYRNPK
jgi:hypothetical protein